MQDILHESPAKVALERAKVANEGWGAMLLAKQASNGTWNPDDRFPEMHTLRTLNLLCDMGLDPSSQPARQAITLVQQHVRWLMKIGKEELPKEEDINWWHKPFFEGEVEPCINGRVLRVGAYFGVNMRSLVNRLLGEQMADGGWNCEQETGSTRGSFHSTINVLEGLLEFESATGDSSEVTAARQRGHEYLLKRQLFRSVSTGEPITDRLKDTHPWTQFAYPAGWRYDILRGLEYLRKATVAPDPRLADATGIVESKRDSTGRWTFDCMYQEEPIAEVGAEDGEPSHWITLRAMRALEWYLD